MPETLKTITGYLRVQTDPISGRRYWRVVRRNSPAGADTPSLRDALAQARRLFGRVTLAVWDADVGEFVSEVVADPAY